MRRNTLLLLLIVIATPLRLFGRMILFVISPTGTDGNIARGLDAVIFFWRPLDKTGLRDKRDRD